MQNHTLPIPLISTSISAAPQRNNATPANDTAKFSQTLSREMAQHQQRPAAASGPGPAKAQAALTPNKQPAPTQAQAKPADAKPATAGTDATKDELDEDAVDATEASPVAELLALVASFNQPAVAAATTQGAAGAAVQAAVVAAGAVAAGADTPGAEALGAPALASTVAEPAVDPAALAAAGKERDLTLAGDAKPATAKDVALALDGAARFTMKALVGAAAPKDTLPAAPQVSTSASEVAPSLPATGAAGLTALTGAAHPNGLEDAGVGAGQANKLTEPASAPTAPRLDVARADAASLRARDTAVEVATLKDTAPAAPVMAPVQQASLAMAQAATGAPTDRIAARVGTPGWDNQVGQKIIWMVAGKEQSASLTLNPPDMGPMQVVLRVTNDQASVTFSAAQPEVRQALEDALPKLREMLSESGIALGNASVNAGLQDQRQAQQGEQARSQRSSARFGSVADAAPVAPAAPRQARTDGGAGLVDTFA
jgi:flagellar hook-length control protein FliK